MVRQVLHLRVILEDKVLRVMLIQVLRVLKETLTKVRQDQVEIKDQQVMMVQKV